MNNEPDSCTTSPAINRGREGRPHTIENIYLELQVDGRQFKLGKDNMSVARKTVYKMMEYGMMDYGARDV